ncbi:Clp protease N-terminal domain-containing protein [Actinopolymorpha alba]|uniref:Clp protease N-terminal domain-containing protein n=1 Tax=Actinopolymorpha alba TaxID=533267 RepID=UPI00035C12FC|nr:Clp protease N-terminal domain-containing protein [Actinopolymorpha alba]
MTPPPSLQDLIDIVRRDSSNDVLDQLATARAMVADLSETGDALLGHYVDRARGTGRSWTEISNVLGVTKQAVHKRFATSGVPVGEFERFTDRARNTLAAATEAARGFGHAYVGTEHLLLGFYAEPESIATKVLLSVGATSDDVATAVLALTPKRAETPEGALPRTPRANAALEGAVIVALELGHDYVGTEHILLALYQDSAGIAARVLAQLGLGQDTAQAKVIEALSGYRS